MPKKQKHESVPESKDIRPIDTSPEKGGNDRWKLGLPRTRGERIFLLVGLVAAVALLWLAIPYSRYGLLGQFIKRPAVIKVTDSRTHKPVSDVLITLGSQKARTDANGEVKLSQVPVGGWQVEANKRYYALITTNIMVPLFGPVKTFSLSLTAIGNQVTIKVTNKITGRGLANASISALGTNTTTDAEGEAVLVLPVDKPKVDGAVKLSGYNNLSVSITNNEEQSASTAFALTPSGKIYYLDKRTGVINVMKSDLDGSNPSVVLAGTGRESDSDTVLLASRDWRYLALKAVRDGSLAKLYLLDTRTDKLSLIDQGDAEFSLTGWYDHYFVYTITRHNIPYWQANSESLKSYNAETDHITTLVSNDSMQAPTFNTGGPFAWDAIYDNISNVTFANDKVVFVQAWNSMAAWSAGHKSEIRAMNVDGGGSTTYRSTDPWVAAFGDLRVVKPNLLYFTQYAQQQNATTEYYKVDASGSVSKADDGQGFDNTPPTNFLLSPSEKATFWYEQRDGKNTLFTGDENAGSAKELASLSDYTPYGWYTDDYLLVSKNKSELYIASADFSSAPIKITDYHRPAVTFNGYGGGYGGQ